MPAQKKSPPRCGCEKFCTLRPMEKAFIPTRHHRTKFIDGKYCCQQLQYDGNGSIRWVTISDWHTSRLGAENMSNMMSIKFDEENKSLA